MLTRLRAQVQTALSGVPAKRRPSLRRCDATDALLATDLPFVAEADAVATFAAEMEAAGVRVIPRNGWLLLDAAIPVPEAAVPTVLAGEAGCCISLLVRHAREVDPATRTTQGEPANSTDRTDGDAMLIRAIVKAAEAGRQPFERLCVQLHGELAARLRQHEVLPLVILPYLCAAYERLIEPLFLPIISP